jgi:hypothetical protein
MGEKSWTGKLWKTLEDEGNEISVASELILKKIMGRGYGTSLQD